MSRSLRGHENAFGGWRSSPRSPSPRCFHDDDFVLLLVVTVLLYSVARSGLNVQFGYAGVVNFAGAAFFGIGGYTAAVLNAHTGMPHLLVLLIGGARGGAGRIASAAARPAHARPLRRGDHDRLRAPFKTFLEVNDVLGGPQGMQVKRMTLFGWSFNDSIEIGGVSASFYLNYFVLSLLVAGRRLRPGAAAGALVDRAQSRRGAARRDRRRLLRPQRRPLEDHRVHVGNFLIGIAGALFGMVGGFIAPNNYTFADSLILVSILLLGGIGNPWGLVVATIIVVVVPEKLQIMQEYRFLLYAMLVIAGAAVPARGPAAAAGAALFPRVAAMSAAARDARPGEAFRRRGRARRPRSRGRGRTKSSA